MAHLGGRARDTRDDSFRASISGRANLDAFGRFKVANPVTLFDSQLQYDTQPRLWVEKLVGGGAVTHRPDESSADLTVGTASGDRVVRQTREYQRYQPGKAQSILCSGVLGAAQAGTTKLVGYGDDNNGVFFGIDGGGRVVSEIVYDPTITGGTWVDIDSGSSTIEGNFTIASFTGGTAVSASIAAGGGAKSSTPVFGRTATDRLPFGLDVDGANPIPLALAVYALDNSVTASFTFQWEEIR